MIWKTIELYRLVATDTDPLGNEVLEPQLSLTTRCRETPWTDAEIALFGADISHNEQKVVIHEKLVETPKYCRINGGPLQEVIEAKDLSPRWTALRIRSYKEAGHED